ncbi:MAG: L,D-transpeptidase [Ferruginibacter sp.]
MLKRIAVLITLSVFFFSCTNDSNKNNITVKPDAPVEKRTAIQYRLLFPKDSIKKLLQADSNALAVIAAVNRADKKFLKNFDTIVLPSDTKQDIKHYFPFPFYVGSLKEINKILFFSYPTQAFAAYEQGKLVYTGPTSMGRKADPTPTGLFYANWKAEETISTFNDEWELKWNFNIENKLGVGFHQYEMPGYPASHSCLRLTEKDAKYLYEWTDQWKIEGTDKIIAHGTPVIVFGAYPFGSSKPWLALAQNPDALMINEADLENTAKPYLADIMSKQNER